MAKGISLHIGLNTVNPDHYGGWSGPLNACEADAEDMLSIAERLGYRTEILKTRSATRQGVIDRLTAASKELGEGDILLVTYSGHGGQLPDSNGDEPDDLMDETWCLYDGQLLDDELYVLWASFARGVRVVVLSDSCHSGSVTRVDPRTAGSGGFDLTTVELQADLGATSGLRYRAAPADVLLRTYRKNRGFYEELAASLPKTIPTTTNATVRLISGCQDNQLSLDGTFNGLFTGTLLRVWNDGRFDGDYREFHSSILRRMPAEQSPNHFVFGAPNAVFDAQRPFTIE